MERKARRKSQDNLHTRAYKEGVIILLNHKDTLTSRERVKKIFEREIPDRVPIDYFGNAGINKKMMDYFNATDYDGLLTALGVDFRSVGPHYTGKPLFENNTPDRHIDSLTGIHQRWVEHSSGGYWDFCDFPLEHADYETIEKWPFPNPDDYDYDAALDYCRAHSDFALHAGGAGLGDIMNSTGMIRGVEQTLVDLVTDDPAGMLYIDKKVDLDLARLERLLEKCHPYLTFVWMGEDLGSQHRPLISLELFRKAIRPRHQKIIDCAKYYKLPIIIHTCGSSSWAYNDFIEMGMDGVDTLQPEAANMSPEYLKKTFGDNFVFHGCISTAGVLAYGTPEDVEENVRKTLEIMMPGSGYMLSPTHQIQDNSPLSNVVRMYEAAYKYGYY